MAAQIIRSIRLGFALVILVVGTVLSMGDISRGVEAQVLEPCAFDDGTDEWACAEGPHLYLGSCEGVDCYTMMEFCCVIIE